MKTFIGEKKKFEVDTLRNREPVEIIEDRGDVLVLARESYKTSGRVLNSLKTRSERDRKMRV